ncbi:PucR family transcriptional regulator [Haloechinothrix halophila]|uniref:PucR family transcriptional regulator n=1 Tax=Haloechinothrix halophila TaxID=1069073 RepID=UPI00040A4A3D|nr:helix-turn-helix domain-containing protein [Haloechinothrix halophila]
MGADTTWQTKHAGELSARTVRKVERASGELAAKSVAAMAERLPWFSRMPADQRASILLITQVEAAGFIEWLRDPDTAQRPTTDAFRNAPQELSRWINMRHTVLLIRIALDVFEQELPKLAANETERATLAEAAVRYGREVAFTAATAYATAAESRGAWDARLEALVVDGIVRGDAEEALLSRASALGWDLADAATAIVGNAPPDDPPIAVKDVRARAARIDRPVMLGVQGSRLIVVVGGPTTGSPRDEAVLDALAESFGDGPVVAGPTVASIAEAHLSTAEALSGLRAVVGWAGAPRPVRSLDLLPERALTGDAAAERQLIDQVARPLDDAGGAIEETVTAYLEAGGVLEACARSLFVHPNTVRYRLKRATELTGRNPMDPRDAFVLRIGLIVGELARSRGTW